MRRYRRRRIAGLLVLFVVGIASSKHSWADTKTVPEIDLYVTHNHLLRSRFVAGLTWTHEQSEFSNATFEYDLDIGLLSYFRRYVFKDPNAEKSKRISFRLGYATFPNLTGDDSAADEKRGIAEITFRLPLGNAWLIADRNRGEYRHLNNSDYGRYRNRLRAERNFAFGNFRMTPYVNAEAYYDGKLGRWSQADATIGSEFPWYYQTILEFYFTWQFKENLTDGQVAGITLQKHI